LPLRGRVPKRPARLRRQPLSLQRECRNILPVQSPHPSPPPAGEGARTSCSTTASAPPPTAGVPEHPPGSIPPTPALPLRGRVPKRPARLRRQPLPLRGVPERPARLRRQPSPCGGCQNVLLDYGVSPS